MTRAELENSLSKIHDWIRVTDQKVSVWLAFQGLVIGISRPYILPEHFLAYFFSSDAWLKVILIAGVVTLLLSLAKTILVLLPRLTKSRRKYSILYFKDICDMGMREYKRRVQRNTDRDLKEDLETQIYTCSVIASRQRSLFSDSIVYFVIGFSLILTYSVLLNILG